MAGLAGVIKASLCVLALLVAACVPAASASFSVKRGINFDIWTTWPGEEQWDQAGTILPYPEWRKSLGAAELQELKQAGFDFVRIPVDPSPFLSDKTLALRSELFASVLESARLVNEAGLKAIVDLHLFPRGSDSQLGMEAVMGSEATFEAYLEIVRTMGRTLAREDPEMVAFELMNEPEGECDAGSTVWPDQMQRLYAAARSSATRLTLVLTGACGGSAEGLAAIDTGRIPDDNILWSFHSYRPFLMTHQGAMWAGDFIRYVTGLTYPIHAMPSAERDAALASIRSRIEAEAPWSRRSGMLSYLDEQIAEIDTPEKLAAAVEKPFSIVAEWAGRHGVKPENILLGEFGMIRQEYGNPSVVPAASRAAYVKDMIGHAEAHGFAWAIWDYGGAFGVVDEFDGRRAEPDVLEVVRGLDR